MERDEALIRRIILALRPEKHKAIDKMPGVPQEVFVFNATILLEEGLVEGQPLPDRTGPDDKLLNAVLLELTPAGKRLAESIMAEES